MRTARTCGCMLHGVVDGCCCMTVPVVQLHVAVVAVSHQLLRPPQPLLAVLQEADTPNPRAAWARGLH